MALALSLQLFFCVAQVQAVAEAAVLFLLIQPSVRANGMAGTSVAASGGSLLAVAFNPAHIGFHAFKQEAAVEFYPTKTKWLPGIGRKGLTYDAYSFMIGTELKEWLRIPMRVGAGYSRIRINLGRQTITGESSPEPIGFFDAWEMADVWSLGIGLDSVVKVGLGLNIKHIDSKLAPTAVEGRSDIISPASANVLDLGFLFHWPVLKTFSNRDKPIRFGNHWRPFLVPGFGLSIGNIGGEITYVKGQQADKLPRVARMGVRLKTGMAYEKQNVRQQIVSFEWSSEAEDLLVKRTGLNTEYEGGLGEINFFDHVIAGNGDENVITRRGWEVNLLGVFSYRQGRYKDVAGQVYYDASGFGLNFTGLIRALSFVHAPARQNGVWRFVSEHMDVEYYSSELDADTGVLDGTSYNGLRVALF